MGLIAIQWILNHKHFVLRATLLPHLRLKRVFSCTDLPLGHGTSRSLLFAAIFNCTFSFLRQGNVCGPYVGIFFLLLSDTYIWMVYDKACYLERTPNELEMGHMGEMRLDYEITFNIWILNTCLVLVKELCKSITMVDLHIFRWCKTSSQRYLIIVYVTHVCSGLDFVFKIQSPFSIQ